MSCLIRVAGGNATACLESDFVGPCTLTAQALSPPAPPPPLDLHPADETCTQQTKQKSIYATFEHSPAFEGATDVTGDTIWENVDDIRRHGNNGLYTAWNFHFIKPSPSGYMGPQITGKNSEVGQVLFSLWDNANYGEAAWLPAMPMTEEVPNHKRQGASMPGVASCNRNCNDCALHTYLACYSTLLLYLRLLPRRCAHRNCG